MRGDVLVLEPRLGVAPMRTHYHVDQDGHRLSDRFPKEAHGLDDGHPAFQGAPRGPVARGALRWESLVGPPGCRTSADGPAGPKNAGVEWCHFQFSLISIRV